LQNEYLTGLKVEDGAESHGFTARLLLQQLELLVVEEGREGVQGRQHAPDAAIQDGLTGIDRRHGVLFDDPVDPRKPQAFSGDVVRAGNIVRLCACG
jgi:hypothetical protein